MTIFEAVRELRKRLGLTQQELAHQTKLAVRTVSKYENNDTPTSDGVLFQFAKLASRNGHADLAEILTPGQPVDFTIDISEVVELMQQVQEAQKKLAEANEKLRRRLTARGVDILWDIEYNEDRTLRKWEVKKKK